MCTNTFNSREAFQEHMMDKHGAQTSRLECSLCHIAFFTKNELKCHTRTHHEPVEQGVEIKCEKCDKSFASKKTMFAHMRNVHNISNKAVKKEKAGEFVCPTCGEKKNSDHNLQQHIRKFHENAFPEPLACQQLNNCSECITSKMLSELTFQRPPHWRMWLSGRLPSSPFPLVKQPISKQFFTILIIANHDVHVCVQVSISTSVKLNGNAS